MNYFQNSGFKGLIVPKELLKFTLNSLKGLARILFKLNILRSHSPGKILLLIHVEGLVAQQNIFLKMYF